MLLGFLSFFRKVVHVGNGCVATRGTVIDVVDSTPLHGLVLKVNLVAKRAGGGLAPVPNRKAA